MNPAQQGSLKKTLTLGGVTPKSLFNQYKQTNLGFPRLNKLFPSLAIKPNAVPPLIIKKHPLEGMMKKLTIEEKKQAINDSIDYQKIDEMLVQGEGSELRIMNIAFRSLPYHIDYTCSSFLINHSAIKNMLYIMKSLSMPQMRIPLSSEGVELYTRLCTGLRGLVNNRSRVLIESLIHYNGEFSRILVLVSLGVGCTVWYTVAPGDAGMAPPTELFPIDVDHIQFFRDSFAHPLFKKMSFIESKYIIGEVMSAFENFYPFSNIDIPVLEVSTQASSSASTSQMTLADVGSTSEASSSASTSQMTLADVGSTSEASSSASTAPRLSENKRSAIKLAVIMSILVGSGVLISEVPNLVDSLI
jgi:hypothetical protein